MPVFLILDVIIVPPPCLVAPFTIAIVLFIFALAYHILFVTLLRLTLLHILVHREWLCHSFHCTFDND